MELFEEKMKYRDNEFLYNKCVKQYHQLMLSQHKNKEYKSKIESLEEDVEYWKEKYKELENSLNNDYDPEIEVPEIHGEGISW